MNFTVPTGRRPRRGRLLVAVTENGSIALDHVCNGRGGCQLSFDEAELLAAALRDAALVVRMRHGVGTAEVA